MRAIQTIASDCDINNAMTKPVSIPSGIQTHARQFMLFVYSLISIAYSTTQDSVAL